ncbi:DNA-binding response regulator [Actinomycetota bacterium]|nr:DNA-binding response regulator [Actinomycetota bacterium]
MRVLIVDDERYLAEAIQEGLRLAAIAADVVHDGDTALEYLAVNEYDAVVLDRDIPGTHGDDVCRTVVARWPQCRVLMLTAARGLEDKVTGFQIGADDYLPKPFELPELVMRLRALVRRAGASAPVVVESHGVRLDPFRRESTRDGHPLALGRKEFAVLELLLRADGGVLSAETLLEKAWDENIDPFTNVVRMTISTLRRKLGEPAVIETVSGVGYRLVSPS